MMPVKNVGRFSAARAEDNRRRDTGQQGFTLVEMLVVITIIVILVTMAIPIYNNTIRRSKEAVLHSNLQAMRAVIDNYTFDKTKAPQSLGERHSMQR